MRQAENMTYDKNSLAPLWYKNSLEPYIGIKAEKTEKLFFQSDEVKLVGYPNVFHTPFWTSVAIFFVLSVVAATVDMKQGLRKSKDDEEFYYIPEFLVRQVSLWTLCVPVLIVVIFIMKVGYHLYYNDRNSYIPWEFCSTVGLIVCSIYLILISIFTKEKISNLLKEWYEDFKKI